MSLAVYLDYKLPYGNVDRMRWMPGLFVGSPGRTGARFLNVIYLMATKDITKIEMVRPSCTTSMMVEWLRFRVIKTRSHRRVLLHPHRIQMESPTARRNSGLMMDKVDLFQAGRRLRRQRKRKAPSSRSPWTLMRATSIGWPRIGNDAGAIWLSKKMAEKGKEIDWKRLHGEGAVPGVPGLHLPRFAEPHCGGGRLDPAQLMRWVLTRKGDGSAKARLVVLGFQAHNLTEVETASPAKSKVGRNLLLTVAASMRMTVKAGDVTSAFLQTSSELGARGVESPRDAGAF